MPRWLVCGWNAKQMIISCFRFGEIASSTLPLTWPQKRSTGRLYQPPTHSLVQIQTTKSDIGIQPTTAPQSFSTKVLTADGGGKVGRKWAINWTSLTWRTFTIIALFNNFQFQANLILPPTPPVHLLRIATAADVRGTYHDHHAWLELFT